MGFFSRLALTPAATGIQRPVSSSEVRIRGEVTRSPAPPSKGSRQLLLRARVQAHVRDPHPRYVRHAPKDQEDPPTSPSPPNPPWRIPPCQQGHPGDDQALSHTLPTDTHPSRPPVSSSTSVDSARRRPWDKPSASPPTATMTSRSPSATTASTALRISSTRSTPSAQPSSKPTTSSGHSSSTPPREVS